MKTPTQRAHFVAETVAAALDDLQHGRSPVITIACRLGDAVHADSVAYARFDGESGECEVRTWPELADPGSTVQTRAGSGSHPILHYWLTRRSGAATVSSSVADRTAWRNSEAYSLLSQGLGCSEIGRINLDSEGATLTAIAIARGEDFRPEEVQLLDDVKLAASALVAHAEWLAGVVQEQPDLDDPLDRPSTLGLTSRELEVLRLLSTGRPATAMAARLSISPRTVHHHLSHIYDKLGTHDRLSAVMCARDAGILAAPAGSARPLTSEGWSG